MEPGHEDREYLLLIEFSPGSSNASMEPGHEDREYVDRGEKVSGAVGASMEPGHEDREYRWRRASRCGCRRRLNGARS